jgi:hypothetical protein
MDDTWKAPAATAAVTQTSTPTFEEDLAATRPSALVVVATLASLIAGVLAAATGFQLIVEIALSRWLAPVPWFMVALGIAAAIISVQLYRMRYWAALTMTALNAGITFFAGAWALFALANGLVSLYGFLAPMVSLGATVCAGLAVPLTQRAKQAAARLAADA